MRRNQIRCFPRCGATYRKRRLTAVGFWRAGPPEKRPGEVYTSLLRVSISESADVLVLNGCGWASRCAANRRQVGGLQNWLAGGGFPLQ